MANRADVFVKNGALDGIQVIRSLKDGTPDLELHLNKGNREKIHLPGPEVLLMVKAPTEADTKNAALTVKSDVDLSVSHSRTNSCWTFKIESNDLPPDSPASVNITVGEDEPT